MNSFHTTIMRVRTRGPLELLATANDEASDDDELEEGEEIELELEVSYTPGYYKAATWEDPPEGDDPEIDSVVYTSEGGEEIDYLDELDSEELDGLVREAWDDQAANGDDDDGGDPDAYDIARDREMTDEYDPY